MPKRLALVSAMLLPLVMGLGTTFAQTPTGQSSSVTQMSKADKEAISKACSEQANAQGFARQGPKKVSIQVQTNPWQSDVVRQLSLGGFKEERLFGSITLGPASSASGVGRWSCIHLQRILKFGRLRLRVHLVAQGEVMLAAPTPG